MKTTNKPSINRLVEICYLKGLRNIVICCTSGSAVLNYAPAIVEAYYQRIPLIVLTADRPSKWIDQGIGQSMRQKEVYSNYIKQSYSWNMVQSTLIFLSRNHSMNN